MDKNRIAKALFVTKRIRYADRSLPTWHTISEYERQQYCDDAERFILAYEKGWSIDPDYVAALQKECKALGEPLFIIREVEE